MIQFGPLVGLSAVGVKCDCVEMREFVASPNWAVEMWCWRRRRRCKCGRNEIDAGDFCPAKSARSREPRPRTGQLRQLASEQSGHLHGRLRAIIAHKSLSLFVPAPGTRPTGGAMSRPIVLRPIGRAQMLCENDVQFEFDSNRPLALGTRGFGERRHK